jgi:hypothetical protein
MIEVRRNMRTVWLGGVMAVIFLGGVQQTMAAPPSTLLSSAADEGAAGVRGEVPAAVSSSETSPSQEGSVAGIGDWAASSRGWVIDYRCRSYIHSQTSYEVGTNEEPPRGWAPQSMLRFPLDSWWNGLMVGVEKPDWNIHVEWLMPMSTTIHGSLADYDWQRDLKTYDGSFTDLGFAKERWTDGQMVTLDAECKASERFLGLPVELWPMAGFRWQRFGLTCYDLCQVKEDNVWNPYTDPGDCITFNQQYYIGYVGGQLRRTLPVGSTEVRMTFQGDWGYTWGYSIDHHLFKDFYGMLASQGSSWHIAFTAEVPIAEHWSIGGQVDYLEIRATGKDWEWNRYGPGPRTNGVCAYSDQTSLTAFLRVCF